MRFKLDENFGTRTQQLFAAAGHEVKTVREQGLAACSDQRLFEVCCAEQSCLVTLDLGFADVTRFPPGQANGMIVVRTARNPSLALLERLVRQVLNSLGRMPLEHRLWVVEVGRIRVHESETDERR